MQVWFVGRNSDHTKDGLTCRELMGEKEKKTHPAKTRRDGAPDLQIFQRCGRAGWATLHLCISEQVKIFVFYFELPYK